MAQVGDPCTTAAGQSGTVQPWYDEGGGSRGLICTTTNAPVYQQPAGTRVTTVIGPPVPPASAPRGPDKLAREADAILASLPAGSGVNPFTSGAAAFPHDPAFVSVRGLFGGVQNVPYYDVYPVPDPSGLILWTGPDSGRFADNLTQAQNLAASVLLAGGDRSQFADYNSQDPEHYGGSYAPYVAPTYEEYREPLPASAPVGYEIYDPTELAPPLPASVTQPSPVVPPMDATQPVVLIDDETGGEIATVYAHPTSGVVFDVPADVDPQTAVNKVTDFLAGIANVAGQVGETAKRVQHAVQGAAAGAQAGYSAPVDVRPWLIGAGVVGAVLLLREKGSSSRRPR